MIRKPSLLNVLVAVVTVVAIAGGFSSFQRNRSAFERLDFRFHWENNVIAVDSVESGSGAARAGLRPGDRVWVIAERVVVPVGQRDR